MSLRLLQKKLGQDSEERQRQLGHAPVQGRRGGNWLGSKPRAPLGRPAPAKESEAQQSNEQGFYTPKGKGGKGKAREGKGRGSSSFLAGFGEQPVADEEPSADWSAPPATSSFAHSSSSVAPASSQAEAIPEEAVEGLTEVLGAAQLQHYVAAAAAWCDEQGAANLTELLEALDDFAQELHLKSLERRRLEKVLVARVGNVDSSTADAAKLALAAAVVSGKADDLRKALADARAASVTGLEEAEDALRYAEAEAELQAATAEGTDAARLEAALEAAKEAGVSQKLISEAVAALESLRSSPEVEGLEAVFEEARLPQHLERASSWAVGRGLSRCGEVNEQLEELSAHLKLKPLERKRLGKALDAYVPVGGADEKDSQRKAAEEALARAASGTAVEPLVRAIAKAEEMGLAVKSAKDRLRTLQAETQRKQAMLDLTTALREDTHAIEVALSYAEEVGVEEGALREARAELKRRTELEQKRKGAESRLAAALEQPDLQSLEAAISEAEEAMMDEDDLQAARVKLEAGKGAQDALVAVMDLDDASALAAAIKSVEEVGLYNTRTLEEAREKLQTLQDAFREREEAEAELADAAGESDIEALEAAISTAVDAGVDSELLKDAEERLQELREKAQEVEEAEEALEHAQANNDVSAMSAAIKRAQAAGVGKEAVATAQAKLQQWKEELQNVQDARDALETAAKAVDVEKLAAAIKRAQEVGVERGLVEPAEQTLLLLRKREEATAAVADALQSGNLHSLTAAIEAAEDEGAGEDDLREARAKVEEGTRALDTLTAAMDADDADALAAAICSVEEVGVHDERTLEDAKERLRKLREALQVREEAEAALADAAGESDVEALEAAISSAADAGVDRELLKDAEERLGELKDRAQEAKAAESALTTAQAQGNVAVLRGAIKSAREARVCEEALAAAQAKLQALEEDLRSSLEVAIKAADIERLSAALERAQEMCVDREVLQPAEETLQMLQTRKKAVALLAEAVANASQDIGFQSLNCAIKAAEEAGAGEGELREARGKVEAGKSAHDSLLAAVEMDDADALASAIRVVEEVGTFSASALEEARERLQKLRAREEAEGALADAAGESDAETLEAAISSAVDAGVSSELLKDAEEKLQQLKERAHTKKEAESALTSAQSKGNLAALRRSIKNAQEAQVCEEALAAAQAQMRNLEEDLHSELEAAVEAAEIDGLSAAIERAREMGVDQERLQPAEQTLQVLQRRREAVAALSEAEARVSQDEGFQSLIAAIKGAEEAGVSEDNLREARAKLEAGRSAHDTLLAVLEMDDADALATAIGGVEVVGTCSREVLEEAREKLRKLREELRVREEAEGALADAAGESDVEALEAAISSAVGAGVDSELLKDAEERLQELKVRRGAEEVLASAQLKGDVAALRAAVDSAREANVSEEALATAQAKLDALEDEQRRVQDIRAAVDSAVKAQDIDRLPVMIEQAREVGVDEASLAAAEQALHRLRRRRGSMEALDAALAQATPHGDLEPLSSAIKCAEEAGVSAEELLDSKQQLQALEATAQQVKDAEATLAEALLSNDIQTLAEAIEGAQEMGVEVHEAEERLAEWQETAKRLEHAQKALALAAEQENIQALTSAIELAEEVGADVQEAVERLAELRERARKLQLAEEALALAAEQDDIEALNAALASAEECGLGKEQLARATERLQELRDEAEKKRVEAALTSIMQDPDIEALTEAVERARTTGIRAEVLKEAEERLQALKEEAQEREEAETALTQAVDSSSTEVLQECIERAVAAKVDEDAVKCARVRLKTLQARLEKRASSEQALAQAMDAGNIRKLSDAITLAVDAGIDKALIEDAGQRLRSLQDRSQQRKEVEETLARATAAEDMVALEAAILRAKELGLHCEALKQAGKVMKSLREKEKKRQQAEEKRRQAEMEEEEKRRQAEIEEKKRRQDEIEEEEKRQAELEEKERRQAEIEEEERRQAEKEEEERRRAEIEEEKRRQAEIEEEERRQAEIEEEERRQAEIEEEERRQAEIEEEKRRQAEMEEQERRQAEIEEEKRRQAEIEEEKRQQEEREHEEKRQQAEKEEKKRQAEATPKKKAKGGGGARASEAAAALQSAVAAEDIALIGAAIAKAEKAGVNQQELAQAKRVHFQLQKDKREQAKREKGLRDAMDKLQAADCPEALQEAIGLAEKAGASANELEEARARLLALQEQQQEEAIQLALKDVEYFIAQGDVEAATVTLEDAAKSGASQDQLAEAEKALADLRERLDPEAEARRRRLEARKAKDTARKWNFAGKSDNRIINDRFREHEAELERRRMLAFRARGRFKGDAEDEGEEGQEKNIRKQRAEVIKERGQVAAPKTELRGFAFSKTPKEESEAPRRLSLRAHLEMGAGIDLHASWWGMVVDSIDDEPGQPGLRLRDVLTEVNGTSLCELEAEDCEQRFADLFGDGCVVTVEPHVEAPGFLNASSTIDKESLQADTARFAEDWGVQIEVEETGRGPGSFRIVLQGPQSAIKASKPELENLMKFYSES